MPEFHIGTENRLGVGVSESVENARGRLPRRHLCTGWFSTAQDR